ncbi:dihydroxyacetone kinase subunit DhaL [Rathayibacter sp. KR2-224]|uniref:dihydroxyacetone kinase subunit DhaL n=1 Tax=Rathayibacter sp. KR2-224 TaxID=3400913 RepID=UPI003C036B51
MTLDTKWAVGWLTTAADSIAAQAAALSELDRAIGDGDHGENMNRGFTAVREALVDAQGTTPSDVLRLAAMKLISSVGGAAGPLYGTAFLRASDAVTGRSSLGPSDVAELVQAALGGIEERGHAEPGDKTMVDAWAAAARAARDAAARGDDAAAVLAASADGAEAGAESTDELFPRKGRASYLGERAVGHRDPGAASTALILRAAVEAAA